ncbi:MAG: DUF4159 domain-containing protein [Candidatus Cloacimonetes bacterium]|nr:DUF4159 domain-containing protein [Candidatus Cloacimonadota bacterium]
MRLIASFVAICLTLSLAANNQIARLHYNGGGDWYNDQDAIPNLCQFLNKHLNTDFIIEESIVKPSDSKIFDYPFIFATGHGKISFNEKEITNLREYFARGGFLYVDDDYGLDDSFREEIKKVFPNKKLVELPINHQIFSSYFKFNKGLPKIHKHDNKRPQAFAIFDNKGRMLVLYTYESNISDGWSDAHNNSPKIRESALKMGANIIHYLITK